MTCACATRICTRCRLPKGLDKFRRLDSGGLHRWCKPCESEAGKQRYARNKHPEGRLAHDCEVVAARIGWMLESYPGVLTDGDVEFLGDARDWLLGIEARLTMAVAS